MAGVEQTLDVLMTVKEKELADAKSAGLLNLVRVGDLSTAINSSTTVSAWTDAYMVVHLADHVDSKASKEMAELDQWEKFKGDADDADLYSIVDESDDDLL
jgi:hypothetical protein